MKLPDGAWRLTCGTQRQLRFAGSQAVCRTCLSPIDPRACAVCRYLRLVKIVVVDRPEERPSGARERRFECANCGNPFSTTTGRASAYCGAKCSTTASAVRYGRAKLLEFGSLDALPEDIKRALQIELAHALGAGYDSNARTIPTATRAFVLKRDAGRCVHCGGVGEEIDHIDGGSNDASNLRLLCKDCHHRVTDAHLRPITDDETLAYRDEMLVRMHSPEPLLPCDDTSWASKWRSWVREHESLTGA